MDLRSSELDHQNLVGACGRRGAQDEQRRGGNCALGNHGGRGRQCIDIGHGPCDTQPAPACHPAIAASIRTGQDAPTATAGSQTMGIVEILGVAGSLSLLAGCRLYLTILATGVAMRFGWLPPPETPQARQVSANPWILGLSNRKIVGC